VVSERKIVQRRLAYRRILGEFFDLRGSDLSELGTSSKAVRDFAWRRAGGEAKHGALRFLKLPVLRSSRAAVKKT
jgi:hypothetical protein